MMEGVIALFIPIITVVVLGIVFISHFYFRSKEKQIMIDKGLSYEQMIELMEMNRKERNGDGLLKTGIIIMFFGIGLGAGLLIEVYTDVGQWIPFLIITMTGLGFIVAYLVAKRIKEKEEQKTNG